MTPEQMSLKEAAEIVALGWYDGNFSDVQARFDALATPAAILSLIAQVEAQATEREKLLNIIASAYQVAGKHDAPARVLDVLADPLAATEEQVEAMLPYQVEALTVPQVYPLSTAPHDGTEVLAWSKTGKTWHQVYWKTQENGDWLFLPPFPPRWACRWNEAYYQGQAEFSHWTPIPAAPAIPAIPGTKEKLS